MNVETFLANFGHIANAPDGVERLRDLVYHLAFAGELVAHSKGNASTLADALASAVNPTGKTRRSDTDSAEALYAIPVHWLWVNIGLIGHDWGQTKPEAAFTYIDVSAIDNKRGVVADAAVVLSSAAAPSRARKVVKKGTVIYSTVRPYLLNIAIIEKEFDPAPIASTAFAVLHPHEGVEAKFLYYYLRSPAFVKYVERVQSGMAYPAISDQKFFAASFPLAPTDEQKRIVAKVDELMTLCDHLEAQQQERERTFPIFSSAAQALFAEAPNPGNLNRIFDETGTVSSDDLRKTILTIAVKGLLASSSPNDESAKKCFPGLVTLDSKSNKRPEAIPNSWERCTYSSLTSLVTSGSRGWKDFYSETGAIFLRTQNIKTDRLILDDVAFVRLPKSAEGMRAQVLKDDILITITGANVTKAARVEDKLPEAYVSQHIALTRPKWSEMSPWLYLCFISPGAARGHLMKLAYGDKPGLNLSNIRDLIIPVPPLAEQRRIVGRVNDLLALVEKLEEQQHQRDQLAEAFAKACVASFTGTTNLERPEKMKAPKTELVSLVSLGKKPKAGADAPLAAHLIKQGGELSAKALWQQSGLEIDAFYHQLKSEIAQGWIVPQSAEMKIVETEEESTSSTLVPALAATDVEGEELTRTAKKQRKRK